MEKASVDFVHALWDELADYDIAAHQAALDHLLEGLCSLVDAQNALWSAVVRMPDIHPQDPLKGWRPHTIHYLRPNPGFEQRVSEIADEIDRHQAGSVSVRLVARAGNWRSDRLCDLADAAWFESGTYRSSYLARGVSDAIWASCPVSADAEVYFGLQRHTGRAPFSEEERELVAEALRGLKWFHRQELLSRGLLIASSPLTDTEKRVLEGMLGGEQEKRIADALGQSYHTTHQHVKRIYQKFGVNNRARLSALWLGRGG